MSDNMNDFNVAALEMELMELRDKRRADMLKVEFDAFMKKLDRLNHDERITLYNALVERLACA